MTSGRTRPRVRLRWWSPAEEDTLRFAEAVGLSLAPSVWIGLIGPMGAGKTRIVQGLARGLGYLGRVRSPTFVLEHRYRGRIPIRHLDLYRLEVAPEDLESSWLEESPVPGEAVLVEWAERVEEPPGDALWIGIEPHPSMSETGRLITLDWPADTGCIRDFRVPRSSASSMAEPFSRSALAGSHPSHSE